MGTARDSDEALLLSGDLEDFGRFYDRYVRLAARVLPAPRREPEVAADLTAETFAAAMVSRTRYQARNAGGGAGCSRSRHHKLTDYRRRGSAESRMRARLGMEPVAVTDEDVELIRWLGDDVAVQIIEELPPEQREAIRAHVLEDQRLRRDRPQRADERGGRPQAGQPRAEACCATERRKL